MKGGKVLFIDDEKHIRLANKQTLELAGFSVVLHDSAEDALKMLNRDWPGVVVCDIRLPKMDGMTFLVQLQRIDIDLPVILITGHGDISTAVQAMRDGAYDFIEKPYPAERLVKTVSRGLEKRLLTLENRELRRELELHSAPGPRIIGRTPKMEKLRATISQVADTSADVLVLGETGTGKELVARSLHENSRRRNNNFVAINCGAVAESIMESELFGHAAGAFTDAKKARVGKFEHANGGTMLLDEIESMPPRVQITLLRVLQERAIERLGSNRLIPVDLRVVAATKADLLQAANQGDFREDLYYRLNVVTITIPPLRERREDIPLLFHHFLLLAGHRYRQQVPMPTTAQIQSLLSHNWPGNVRELRNFTERYVLLGKEFDWSLEKMLSGKEESRRLSLARQVENFESSLLEHALASANGNLKEVMALLDLPRKTLYDKMKKYGLDKSDYKDSN